MFESMTDEDAARRQMNDSSFHASGTSNQYANNSNLNNHSLNESGNDMSEDDKILLESKNFVNYLKAMNSITPSFGENENTKKLIDIMQQLKDTNSNKNSAELISSFQRNSKPNNEPSSSQNSLNEEIKERYNHNRNTQFKNYMDMKEGLELKPNIENERFRTQPRVDRTNPENRIINIIGTSHSNEVSKKVRNAYRSLIQDQNATEPDENELSKLAKLNSDELEKWVKDSQKKRLERLTRAEEITIKQPNFAEISPNIAISKDSLQPSGAEIFRKIAEEYNLKEESEKPQGRNREDVDSNDQENLQHQFSQDDPNIFDEMENGEICRSIGSHLYQDFKNRRNFNLLSYV